MSDIEQLFSDMADTFQEKMESDRVTMLELTTLISAGQAPSLIRMFDGPPKYELVIIARASSTGTK
jgi:hypothetical protein